jgi:hypothetical protein
MNMSAPELRKVQHFSLLNFSNVGDLPKPYKVVVYLLALAVLTVAAVGALTATVVIIGEVTGSLPFPILTTH